MSKFKAAVKNNFQEEIFFRFFWGAVEIKITKNFLRVKRYWIVATSYKNAFFHSLIQ